jgi:hypothetical protein
VSEKAEGLTNERAREILDYIMRGVALSAYAYQIIRGFETGDWEDVYDEENWRVFEEHFVASQREREELFKPHLREVLKKVLGAKEVIIKW